jgi:hypothetical protein
MEDRGHSQWRRGGSKWSPIGSVDQWCQIRITWGNVEQDPDPNLSENLDQDSHGSEKPDPDVDPQP